MRMWSIYLCVFILNSRLQNKYIFISFDSDPWDIDVYPGGLLERHNNGAKTGDLFKKMMSDQFLRIKLGDRFWYEQGEQDWSFTGGKMFVFFISESITVSADRQLP